MPRESCLRYRPHGRVAVLREDLLAICDGNHCAAMILSQMLHHHEIRLQHVHQAEARNEALVRAGREATQDTSLWLYKPQPEMGVELMHLFGEKALSDGYKLLLKKGFLDYRTDPENPRDRTREYLFQVTTVQKAVDALPPVDPLPQTRDFARGDRPSEPKTPDSQDGKNASLQAANMRFGKRKNAACKPQDRGLIPREGSDLVGEGEPGEISTGSPTPPQARAPGAGSTPSARAFEGEGGGIENAPEGVENPVSRPVGRPSIFLQSALGVWAAEQETATGVAPVFAPGDREKATAQAAALARSCGSGEDGKREFRAVCAFFHGPAADPYYRQNGYSWTLFHAQFARIRQAMHAAAPSHTTEETRHGHETQTDAAGTADPTAAAADAGGGGAARRAGRANGREGDPEGGDGAGRGRTGSRYPQAADHIRAQRDAARSGAA